MRRRSLAIFFLLFVTMLAASVTNAQERFGTLTGRVTDQQDQAVPGVTVTVTNLETGAVRTFVTDTNGQYSANDLNPGRYSVAFELSGFAKLEHPDVSIVLGRSFSLDGQL